MDGFLCLRCSTLVLVQEKLEFRPFFHNLERPDMSLARLLLLNLAVFSAFAQAQDKPNIVFIFMDNFGYGELGVYGGGITRGGATPRIDDLAS